MTGASEYSPPSRNPADNDTLIGLFRLVLTKFLQNTDDMLPAKVIAYDRETNRATVQPMVCIVTTGNQQVSRAQIASVPVLTMGGGNGVLSFNLVPGDLGWIKANDRDISVFLQALAQSPPNTLRLHDFSNGLFIPDKMNQFTLNSEDAENAVFQTHDGTVRVALWSNQVKITAPTILLDSPVVTITGIINVQNTNEDSTPCTVNGNITTNGDVIASGTSLHTHIHGGVTAGGSDTGVPV
jgi:phage baseplate assembly protein gpV